MSVTGDFSGTAHCPPPRRGEAAWGAQYFEVEGRVRVMSKGQRAGGALDAGGCAHLLPHLPTGCDANGGFDWRADSREGTAQRPRPRCQQTRSSWAASGNVPQAPPRFGAAGHLGRSLPRTCLAPSLPPPSRGLLSSCVPISPVNRDSHTI